MLQVQLIKINFLKRVIGLSWIFNFLIFSLIGCDASEPKTNGLINELKTASETEIFNEDELAKLTGAADLMVKIYQESGVIGMKVHVTECYEDSDHDTLICMGGDFFASLVDKEMSRINNFPREHFFQENQVISRLAQSKIFEGEDMFVLFMVASRAQKEILKHSKKLGGIIVKTI
jgi:hypothetical protein